MIQSIYNQVGKVGLTPCSKERTKQPIPLLKSNFLGEFQTELEKKLARESIDAVTDRYTYPGSDSPTTDINAVSTIYEALDYALALVKSYQSKDVENTVFTIKSNLEALTDIVKDPNTGLDKVNSTITTINSQITNLNTRLDELDVSEQISQWVTNHSGAVSLDEKGKLGFAISKADGNAISTKDDGLYVENAAAAVYHSELGDNVTMNETIGGLSQGTKVSDLKGTEFSKILDKLLFPIYTRELVYPQITSNVVSQLAEINSTIIPTDTTFVQGDAGALISKTDTISYNGQPYTDSTYTKVGDYTYSVSVSYKAGDYLIDDRGNTTTQRVEAGTINQDVAVITVTYPWYYQKDTKGPLVIWSTQSDVMEIELSGTPSIKIPGANSTLDVFKVNGGLGFLDVDMNGWKTSTEQINGITYKVWTKTDSYASVLPHQIQFTTAQ